MNGTLIFLIVALIIVGVFAFVAITLTQNRKYAFNKEQYQTAFLAINNSLKRDNPASAEVAIIKADKLVDQALVEMGVQGKTMGERMKRLHGRFSEENAFWGAHKMRNQIAHETAYRPSYDDARRALAAYKTALKDIGAI